MLPDPQPVAPAVATGWGGPWSFHDPGLTWPGLSSSVRCAGQTLLARMLALYPIDHPRRPVFYQYAHAPHALMRPRPRQAASMRACASSMTLLYAEQGFYKFRSTLLATDKRTADTNHLERPDVGVVLGCA